MAGTSGGHLLPSTNFIHTCQCRENRLVDHSHAELEEFATALRARHSKPARTPALHDLLWKACRSQNQNPLPVFPVGVILAFSQI